MSAQQAPSPAPRSASTGPNGPLPTPTGAPVVNGVISAPSGGSAGITAPAPPAGTSNTPPTAAAASHMNQQNLNQITPGQLLVLNEDALCTTCFAKMAPPKWKAPFLRDLPQVVRQQIAPGNVTLSGLPPRLLTHTQPTLAEVAKEQEIRASAAVIDYLAKKGYVRTEAVLRAESANQEIPREHEIRPKDTGPPKYHEFFGKMQTWVDDSLDLYKPEVHRLLWPFFVYSYIRLVDAIYTREAVVFFKRFQEQFRKEHEYDLRRFERITLPDHQNDENIAKIYKDNKYRMPLSNAAFNYFMQFLESLPQNGFKLMLEIIEKHMDIRQVERAADDRFSFAAVLLRGQGQDMPLEDEGIPGHRPGNAVISNDPTVGNNLANLKLGKMPMEKELEEDVRGDLMDLDLSAPPIPGAPTLLETHEKVNIKQEDEDEGPNRSEIPFPPSTARDVSMEVQKIRENRDRFKIEGRTGGIGPALSCVIYTFHNTHDGITCLDFSGDNNLVAAGTSDSYIRVWTMDGSPLGPAHGGQQQNSQRLIGHSGPVYTVQFAPSTVKPDSSSADTEAMWLMSCAADGTIRLWNLKIWQCVVAYKGHVGPVWSVSWAPFGHYFVSGGMDKTARLWTTDKVKPVRFFAGHDEDVDVVAWHPNSTYVFTASSDKTVRMWAITNGNAVRMFTGHTSPITALACSRDGKTLASADDNGNIMLWDLGPGRLLKKMRGHGKGGVWALSWSVESSVLVSGGADNTVRVWDVAGPAKEPTATKPGDPFKPDSAAAQAGVNLGPPGQPKKKGKDAVVSSDQISAFLTKSTPVYHVKMTNMNLVIAGGAFLPENQAR